MFYDIGVLNKQKNYDLGSLKKENIKDIGIIIKPEKFTYILITEDNYRLATEDNSYISII